MTAFSRQISFVFFFPVAIQACDSLNGAFQKCYGKLILRMIWECFLPCRSTRLRTHRSTVFARTVRARCTRKHKAYVTVPTHICFPQHMFACSCIEFCQSRELYLDQNFVRCRPVFVDNEMSIALSQMFGESSIAITMDCLTVVICAQAHFYPPLASPHC